VAGVASADGSARPARTRRRLSRTFSRARWREYRALLVDALQAGYRVRPAEEHFLATVPEDRPVLLLRHDVDQAPRSALKMADIEQRLGVRASWYFRWRTAHPAVVTELRRRGGTIGLHYETLTRRLLAETGERDPAELLAACRSELREEIASFIRQFGRIRSVCAHGDTRAPAARNLDLLAGQDPRAYGVDLDLDAALRSARLSAWLTDRSRAEGSWKEGLDPGALICTRATPLLLLTHPNNWASGPALWADRLAAEARPAAATAPVQLVRTARDAPPR
jgi:hypothetical protein